MAKKKEETQEKKTMTRAQKTEATKRIVKELLAIKPTKHNELIEEVAKLYAERHGEDTETVNDLKGRAGSVLDIMKKESEVGYDGGMYALKARLPIPPTEVEEGKPAPKKRGRSKKTENVEAPVEVQPVEEKTEEKLVEEAPAKKKTTRKSTKKVAEKVETPVEGKSAEEKAVEEKPAPKKRGRKPKTEEKAEETAQPLPDLEEKTPEKAAAEAPVEKAIVEEKKEPPVEVKQIEEAKPVEEKKEALKTELVIKPKAEIVEKGVVMDMSFLFGDAAKKAVKKSQPEVKAEVKREEKQPPTVETKGEKPVEKREEKKPVEIKKTEEKQESKPVEKAKPVKKGREPVKRQAEKPMTADEKLKESFLKRMRTLGGDYFEYYSVYLLERYSMKNGRRLEGLSISGGDHDGGIDGEIVLTDKFGFRETIYIQSKNWDPEKGKEENWVVGETLLQQFIGACACRQAKEGKQHCRGIFITTSRFTPDAKRILEDMSDKIIGYDGSDLYEAAKECEFGVIRKNGEWSLDEKLLSGTKAFFQLL